MKRILAILLTFAMMTGACAAFAEQEKFDMQELVEQASAEMANAGMTVTLQDMSSSGIRVMLGQVLMFFGVWSRMDDKTIQDIMTAQSAIRTELKDQNIILTDLTDEDAQTLIQIVDRYMDALEGVTPVAIASLKAAFIESAIDLSVLEAEEQEAIIYTVYEFSALLKNVDRENADSVFEGLRQLARYLVPEEYNEEAVAQSDVTIRSVLELYDGEMAGRWCDTFDGFDTDEKMMMVNMILGDFAQCHNKPEEEARRVYENRIKLFDGIEKLELDAENLGIEDVDAIEKVVADVFINDELLAPTQKLLLTARNTGPLAQIASMSDAERDAANGIRLAILEIMVEGTEEEKMIVENYVVKLRDSIYNG